MSDSGSQVLEIHALVGESLEKKNRGDLESRISELWGKTEKKMWLFKKEMEVVKSDAKRN